MRRTRTCLKLCALIGALTCILLYCNIAGLSRWKVRASGYLGEWRVHQSALSALSETSEKSAQSAASMPSAKLQAAHQRLDARQMAENLGLDYASQNAYIRAMLHHASNDGQILLSLVDRSFVPMVVNFFLTSLQPLGITNYLILTMDVETCKSLIKHNINCFQYINMEKFRGEVSAYGSKEFLAKMNIRTHMILEALSAGFRVLHSDVDMLFIKDPFTDDPCPFPACDMAIMDDTVEFNAGFLFVNPSNVSKGVYRSMKEFAVDHPDVNDQDQLNRMVKAERKRNRRANFTTLSRRGFQCGYYYYEQPHRYFSPAKPCPECVMVHNNWIVSMAAKVYRAKELHQWVNDAHGYYTDPTRKYLVYHNPPHIAKTRDDRNETSEEDIRKMELEALKVALQVASILNRTLILPRLHLKQEEVPLNALFRVVDFDREFEYRESTFLVHPLVPLAVKRSVFGPVLILTSFVRDPHNDSKEYGTDSVKKEYGTDSDTKEYGTDSGKKEYSTDSNTKEYGTDSETTLRRFYPKRPELGMMDTEILENFGALPQSVLSFHSMYHALAGFTDKEQSKYWQNKFQQGLRPAGYRQY